MVSEIKPLFEMEGVGHAPQGNPVLCPWMCLNI